MNKMKVKFKFVICSLSIFCTLLSAQPARTPIPELRVVNGHHQLIVDGKPYFMFGGQCGNSSNWPAALPEVWRTMEEMHANTLEIPIYWEEIEAVQGKYDFTSVQRLLDQAREHDMRLVLLWFATWKNSSNHYMPEWMKLQSKRFPNAVKKDGGQADSPSPHCQEAMELDAKAFKALMQYLKDNDPCHTVIMVQVENEPGNWDSVRDYSKAAEKLFSQHVPEALLKKEILSELGAVSKSGTWTEVFADRADEYFNAWYVASYIGYVAAAGKSVNPLPMYVNAALRNPFGNPPATQYESGGPTDNVIAIYKAAAPAIDVCAPDIYMGGDANVMKIIELYSRKDNALFVPECGDARKYLYEVISRGIGYSPFGVDGRTPGSHSALAEEYSLLVPVADKLSQWAAEGRIFTSFEPEDHSVQTVDLGEWDAVLAFGNPARSNSQPQGSTADRSIPATGKAMIVKMGEGDFLVVGSRVRFSFRPKGRNEGKFWHFLRVEEGHYDNDGNWVMHRVLNGDQTDWTGPYVGQSPAMLRIKVYARETIK